MKPYRLNVYNKEVAQALVGIFIAGMHGKKHTPDEVEAIEIVTRLGEWSEDLTDA